MSIVCFNLGGGREVHLVTVSVENLPAPPPEGEPEYATLNGYMTASWIEGDVAMMLIGKVERADLEKLFVATTKTALLFRPHNLLAAR